MTIPAYVETPVERIPEIRDSLEKAFRSGKTKSVKYRKEQLLRLAYFVKDNVKPLQEALAKDLGRADAETSILELGNTLGDIKTSYENVAKWAKPERLPFMFNWFAMKPTLRKEPKGVVLIIFPFNYPIWLSLGPMAGAIAAGCAVVLKPSELTPAYSALIAELLPKYLDPEIYTVVNGAVPQATKLLELRWGQILYTGGGRVGQIILSAAAKTLTPVSTELGGKSPAVIDPNCDLKTSAKRLIWGKMSNSGQTCVAPDYVLVPKAFEAQFAQALKEVLYDFYPEGAGKSDSFSHMINGGHFERVKGLLDATHGEIVYGGSSDKEKLFIEPTIVTGVKADDSLMSEEIFGPVLPIVPVEDVDEAIEFINARDHPLALYIFSKSAAFKSKVIENTQSGSAIVNDTLIHGAVEGFPFGGVGPSGSGAHKGKFSFDMFTHIRPTLDNPSWVEMMMSGRYPPYTVAKASSMAKLIIPSLPSRPSYLPKLEGTVAPKTSNRWGVWFLVAVAVAGYGLIRVRRSA
ncbi:hypothetical protein EVG20_g8816 [Dentipellis fragilis]|uniref:Aldehyde dehydrogenase n=1 Tax=Dentipellis fragilis TaxID=205917 RepID=A0A4Y9Y551_9AGAM|nr:hypothetical protein EVG20_g8816 [Dentipellis fragilis]